MRDNGQPTGALYVVDEKGRLVGHMTARSVDAHDDARRPIKMSTASDLAEPVAGLRSDITLAAARMALANSEERELPVVSAATAKMIGVLKSSV